MKQTLTYPPFIQVVEAGLGAWGRGMNGRIKNASDKPACFASFYERVRSVQVRKECQEMSFNEEASRHLPFFHFFSHYYLLHGAVMTFCGRRKAVQSL